MHGFAGRRKLPGRHIRCASGAPQRATLARTALMRRSLRWLCRLLIAAVLADVALCGAPDAHLVCLPGSNLLPAGSHSPPSWGCNPEEEPSMPSTCSVLHVRHSDSSAYTLFVLHYAMHSTRWTDLHAWHCMHSTAAVSRTALCAQCDIQHSTTCTALHAQPCLDSTACTALHWCWCMI